MTLVGGAIVNITPTYTGTAHLLGDLSNNGTRGIEDYQILTSNMHKSFTTLGQAEAYLKGDMNGDLVVTLRRLRRLPRSVFGTRSRFVRCDVRPGSRADRGPAAGCGRSCC